jgi:hypothetical protein
MTLRKIWILLSIFAWLLVAVSCNRSVVTGSKLTLSNYDQITTGMTKTQVERILGPPTTVETKDMMIFKKTTYRPFLTLLITVHCAPELASIDEDTQSGWWMVV